MKSRKQSMACAVLEALEQRQLMAVAMGEMTAANVFGSWDAQDAGTSVAMDHAGNSYVTGYFYGSIDMDPTKKGVYLLKGDAKPAGFIAKYSPTGKLVWAKRMAGKGGVMPMQVKVGPTGDLFLAGTYDGPFGFQAKGRGTILADTNGGTDVFVIRLRADGRLMWAGNVGGDEDDSYYGMDAGADGDVYLAGAFRLEGDLDPSRGVYSMVTQGVDDAFVSRVNGTTGKLTWAKVYGEDSTMQSVTGIAADGKGGVYVTGTCYREIAFDRENSAFTLPDTDSHDVYLGYLRSNGGKTPSGASWNWVISVGGEEDDEGGGLALGPTGDVYVTGSFGATAEFQPGVASSAMTSMGERDAFVARYSSKGKLAWARQFGGEEAAILGKVVAVDEDGSVYAAGEFNGTVYFTQGRRPITMTKDESDDAPKMNWMDPADIYVAKLTANGAMAYTASKKPYVKQIGGRDSGMAVNGIVAAANGDVVLTGGYGGWADFNPGTGTYNRHTSDEKREMDAWWVRLSGGVK
jgi:hypothetical protein